MSANDIFVYLGAGDPEMEAIENLLLAVGVDYTYAVDAGGNRVTSRTAYEAVFSGGPYGHSIEADALQSGNSYVVLVECDGRDLDACWPVARVDHHKDGDRGFGMGPELAVTASSLGQMISILAGMHRLPKEWEEISWPYLAAVGDIYREGDRYIVVTRQVAGDFLGRCVVIPTDLVICAAADHCPAAAYAGKVPAVDPQAVASWRINTRAAFQKRDPVEVMADVKRAADCLRNRVFPNGDPAPVEVIGGVEVVDMRKAGFVKELPEASLWTGIPFLAEVPAQKGQVKVVLQGCGEGTVAGPEPIRAFLAYGKEEACQTEHVSGVCTCGLRDDEGYAVRHGLTGRYGDPARGYAGAYDYQPEK